MISWKDYSSFQACGLTSGESKAEIGSGVRCNRKVGTEWDLYIHDKEIHGNPKDNDDNGMTTTQYIYIYYVLTMAYKIIECVVLEAIGRYFANLARDSQVLKTSPSSITTCHGRWWYVSEA